MNIYAIRVYISTILISKILKKKFRVRVTYTTKFHSRFSTAEGKCNLLIMNVAVNNLIVHFNPERTSGSAIDATSS